MRVFGRRWRPTRGGGSKEAWTAIARNMEDHWSLVLGFDNNSDSSISATIYFFIFFLLWVVGSVIRGRHRCWSPAWEALLVSLLAWGWKTHVGLEDIYRLQGLVQACSRSHGAKTWKVPSYLVGLLFWWFCFQVFAYGCVVWIGT